MADEARLNEILDLVEQARAEGDAVTEQKAIAAYKRETAPIVEPAPAGGGYNPFASALTGSGQVGMAELGMTPENVKDPILNALGPLETMGQMGTGLAGAALGGVAGIGQGIYNTLFPDPTNTSATDRVSKVQNAIMYQPRTGLGSGMSRVVGLPGEVYGAGTNKLGEVVTDVTGSPVLGAAIKTGGDIAPAFLSRGSVKSTPKPKGEYIPKVDPIKTTEQLRAEKAALYKASEETGVVIRPESTQKIIDMVRATAKEENLSATRLPPKMKEAVEILEERIANKEPLTLKDADKVRQLFKSAIESTDGTDRLLGAVARDKLDEFLENLSPADTLAGNTAEGLRLLQEARATHRRMKNSEMLDDMEERASVMAEKNYTQAGEEHALRSEFGTLAKNMKAKKKFTPEEWAAIQQVAKPGAFANTMRGVGKFDPARSGMGATLGLGIGGGVGATIGGLAAGPAGAGAGALAGQAALGTAANLANRKALGITKKNVANAREVLVGPRGLLSSDKPLVQPRGLLSQPSRSATEIRADLQVLDAEVLRLKAMGPVADTVRTSVEAEVARLRQELSAAESQAGLL